MMEVGVANPKAQGQEMTKTLMEVIKAILKSPPHSHHPRKLKREMAITTGTFITSNPIGKFLT